MPNCFQLLRKGKEDEGPVSLIQIDEEICDYFGFEIDPDWYHHCWFETIGYDLAFGKSFEDIKKYYTEEFPDTHMVEIIVYLEERFIPKSFYERKS